LPFRQDAVDRRLARNLKSVREARGVSQTELGQRLGMDRAQVAALERNDRPMLAAELQLIGDALDADVRWFFVDTTKRPTAAIGAPPPSLELRIMQTEIEAQELRDLWRFLRFAEAASSGADGAGRRAGGGGHAGRRTPRGARDLTSDVRTTLLRRAVHPGALAACRGVLLGAGHAAGAALMGRAPQVSAIHQARSRRAAGAANAVASSAPRASSRSAMP
jgi:transcriptional regulator with XRE-family HTH domain